jgi:hypothetical protein
VVYPKNNLTLQKERQKQFYYLINKNIFFSTQSCPEEEYQKQMGRGVRT